MPEVAENTSVAEPVAEASVSPTSFIGDDGNFTENWMEVAGIPEELRVDQTLKTTRNLSGLASQLVNAQKMIGKHADMVVVPNEKSTQSEWDEYHKAGGRPDTPDEYAFEHVEGIESDPELETAFKNLAHSEGLRPATVQKLIEMDDNRILMVEQAMKEAKIAEVASAEEALKKQWGAAYDERLNLANRMIQENVSEDNKPALLDAIGNNPMVADFLANIAKKFVEHKIISAEVDQPTPVEAHAAIEGLRNTPGYITGELANTSPARYKQITQEIAKLYQGLHPEDS